MTEKTHYIFCATKGLTGVRVLGMSTTPHARIKALQGGCDAPLHLTWAVAVADEATAKEYDRMLRLGLTSAKRATKKEQFNKWFFLETAEVKHLKNLVETGFPNGIFNLVPKDRSIGRGAAD